MRSVAAVTLFLYDMAALAESGADLLGKGQVFALGTHAVPRYGMTALLEFGLLLGVTFAAFFREDHGFLFGRGLVVQMAGHALDPFFRMFRLRPRLEEAGGHPLMAFHAESRVHLGRLGAGTNAPRKDEKRKESQKGKKI